MGNKSDIFKLILIFFLMILFLFIAFQIAKEMALTGFAPGTTGKSINSFNYTRENIAKLTIADKMALCGIQYPFWKDPNIKQPFPDIRQKCLLGFAELEKELELKEQCVCKK